MLARILLSLWFVLALADTANAGPLVAAIGTIVTGISGALAASPILGMVFRTVIGLGLSLLQQALNRQKNKQSLVGTTLDIKMGDDQPMTFPIGARAVAGRRKYIGSWGSEQGTPNAYLTDVIEISNLPSYAGPLGMTSLWVGQQKCGVLWDRPHPDGRGYPVQQFMKPNGTVYMWIKYYDGTQTAADPFLVSKFGSHPDRPYGADRIGRGCQYVIVTTRLDNDLQLGGNPPEILVEPHPTPFYDPRKDSTNGGFGNHRYGNWATYEPTLNPMVIAYNVARGIYYTPDEWVFGGQAIEAIQLPNSAWFAAMNECDRDNGSGVAQYRCGLEVQCDQEPLDVIEALRLACSGRIAENGGIIKPLVGAPGAAVYSFDDDGIVITEEQDFQPFPSLKSTHNGIAGTYPEPNQRWTVTDAPEQRNPDQEAADGNRYLPAPIRFDAVPFSEQVQHLMKTMAAEQRRFRVHTLTLPPSAWALEPNDVVSWTSARNNYSNKKFILTAISGSAGMLQRVTLLEIDPTDFSPPSIYVPAPNGWIGPITAPSQPMTGWTVEPATIKDPGGIDRRPAIKISCSQDLEDVAAVWVQVRLKATGDVVFDSDANPYASPYSWIISGQWMISNTDYEARGRYLPQSNRATDWSAWLAMKTPNVLIQAADVLDGAIIQSKIADAAVSAAKIMDEAVSSLKLADQAVSTAKLQVAAVTADVLASGAVISTKLADGAVTAAKLAQGAVDATALASSIKAVEVLSVLPTTGNIEGRQGYLTTDGKLYRFHNGAWTAAVAAGDVSGTLISSQIADNSITAGKLADGTIVPSKIADGAVTNSKLANLAIDAAKLADSAITSTKIADNSISTPKLQANAVVADKIAANAVTVDKLIVGNFDNIIDNGFSQGNMARWIATGMQSYYLETGASPLQGTWLVSCDARDQLLTRSPLLKVSPGESYNLSVWFYNTDAANYAFIGVYLKDQSGAATGANWIAVGSPNDAKNAWTQMQGIFTVPAGVYQIQPMFGVAKSAANGNICIWGKPNMRRAASSELIVDGAITAAKILANTITGDKIAAGTISGNLLAVGLGTNWLQNSDTIAGLTGWGTDLHGLSDFWFTRRTDGYAPPGGAFEMHIAANKDTTTYADMFPKDPNTGGQFRQAVVPGQWYEFSAYYYGLNCKGATFYTVWIDAAGNAISYTANNAYYVAPQNGYPNGSLATYKRVFTLAQAPAGAVIAMPFVRHEGVAAGQADSYVWVTRLFFGEATQYQTEPSPWSPAGITVVNGGNISTGAITAGKIAANAVTAGTIAAGAVSAAQIAAGAITADKLAAGSVSTQALAVGTGGNYLTNSDLNAGLTGWAYEWSNEWASFRLALRTDTYAPLPGAIEIYQGNGNQGVEYGVTQVDEYGNARYFPVKPGGWYELSVYYFGHRCSGVQPYLGVLDANDNLLAYPNWGVYPAFQNFDPQKSLANYSRFWGKVQMPANAAKVRVFFRMKGTVAGQSDSYLWLTRMYFGEANPNQTEPTPWSDGSLTLISGGNIVSNAVTADKIAANAVTAGKIAANAVTAGTIAAGAVTAATIAAGTITGDKLAANTIGANQIVAGAITAKQLVLTDFSNMADNGWQTGTLDGWTIQNLQNFYLDSSNGDQAGYVVQSLGRDCARSNFITVSPGETYAFDVWVYNADAGSANIYAALLTPSGNWGFFVVAGTTAKNQWVRLQGRFAVPSGYTKIAMLLQVEKTAGTGSSCYWSKPVMRRAVSAELIVDGAITANKISVNSLDAITANLGAVNISSAIIGTLQVGTSNIAGGAVTRVDSSIQGQAGINSGSGPIPVTGITAYHGTGSPPILVMSSFSMSNNGTTPAGAMTEVEVYVWDSGNNAYTAVLPLSFYKYGTFAHAFTYTPPAGTSSTQFRFDVKPLTLQGSSAPLLLVNNRSINALTLKR